MKGMVLEESLYSLKRSPTTRREPLLRSDTFLTSITEISANQVVLAGYSRKRA